MEKTGTARHQVSSGNKSRKKKNFSHMSDWGVRRGLERGVSLPGPGLRFCAISSARGEDPLLKKLSGEGRRKRENRIDCIRPRMPRR